MLTRRRDPLRCFPDTVPHGRHPFGARRAMAKRHQCQLSRVSLHEKKPSNAMAGVPVWSHNGIVCTGETYTKVVKLTFARGARIPDPARLFNSSLKGNTRRAIDIHEGEQVDAGAFQALVKAAVAQNGPPAKKR